MGVRYASRGLIPKQLILFDVLRITQPEEEHKESWRSIDEEQKEAFKSGPLSQWDFGAGEMVKTTTKIIKVCFVFFVFFVIDMHVEETNIVRLV